MTGGTRGGQLGSAVLLLVAAALLLRPWEGARDDGGAGGPASAPAYVVRAVDGDTIEARIGGRLEDVRYIGVDTPETVKPGTPVQCFGHRASDYNQHLVERRRVRLVFGVERRDIYGRLLAYVYIGHRFVNGELMRWGLARTLTIAPNTLHRALFERLQGQAARRGRGLWGAC
jgi:micrococcal nuclease